MAFTKKQERALRGVLLLIPILIFVLLELTLRVFNYGTDTPLVNTLKSNPDYYTINPKLGQRFFLSQNVGAEVSQTEAFLKKKPPSGVRIFTLGGSTTAGFPYEYNARFPSTLKVILKAYYPDKHIEIINLAMPAVSSYAVRDIALELADYAPDLILIYSGHNEFYGGFGVGSTESLGNLRWLTNLYLSLQEYKTLQLIRDAIMVPRNWIGDKPDDSRSSRGLMDHMARERHIPYGSSLYHRASEAFEANIKDVVEYCQEHHIPVLIGTLVSNIRHHQPFRNAFKNRDSETRWKKQFKIAQSAFDSKAFETALEELERCVRTDSLPASQHFLKGEIHLALGDNSSAYQAFYKAKEYDALRFRASEDLNERLYRIGRTSEVAIVPIKKAFEQASPRGLPGNNLFLEHLHPNVEGYRLMAKTFAAAIAKAGIIEDSVVGGLPDSLWIDEIYVTEVDLAVAELRIQRLTQRWPFTPESSVNGEGLDHLDSSPIRQLAWQFCNRAITWETMHVRAAEYYSQLNQWDKAEREYRALLQAMPMHHIAHIYLGNALMRQESFGEALKTFEQSLEIQPSAYAYKMMGRIFMMREDAAVGKVYFEEAVKIAPNDIDAQFDLAQTYAMTAEFEKANIWVQRVLRRNGQHPGARRLSEYVEQQLSRANQRR